MKTSKRIQEVKEYYFATKLREIRNRQSTGEDIINLGIGSPDLSPPEPVKRSMQEAIDQPGSFMYKPYLGLPALRSAMTDFYHNVYGVSLEQDSFIPLLGSKEGIAFISLAYLDEGDEVLVPNPGYPAYDAATKLAGGTCVQYDLDPDRGWHPAPAELDALITDRTRILWLNYPNMPTGARAHPESLKPIIDIARKRNILVCHDNPYSTILAEHPFSLLSIEGAMSNTIELNSLSKAFNMAGARVGMLCGDRQLIEPVFRVQSNFSSGMFEPLQHAAAQALGLYNASWFQEVNNTYAERRKIVWQFLDALNCTYRKDSAGLFVWARTPAHYASGEQLSEMLLNKAHVFVAPGQIFGNNGSHYIRISLCAPLHRLEEAGKRIHRLIHEPI